MPKNIMDPLDLWTQELLRLQAKPPAHIPEARFDEYRAHFDRGLACIEQAAAKEDGLQEWEKQIALPFLRLELAETVKAHVVAAARCGVYEKRAPNGPAELAFALLEEGPHNRERTYPVPQPRTTK